MKYIKTFEKINLDDILKKFCNEYTDELYPEINGVGVNNEQSINGKIFYPANIVVYLKNKDNINKMPSKYMGIDVIYTIGKG